MPSDDLIQLLRVGSDGLNNQARCLINMGQYDECLQLISSPQAKKFGENIKLCKVFVVALFNLSKLEECNEYLRKCETLLGEIIEKRKSNPGYEKGIEIEAQRDFLTKYYQSVKDKAAEENIILPEEP